MKERQITVGMTIFSDFNSAHRRWISVISSSTFVWLHFPKTAGTAVEHIFETFFRRDRDIQRDHIARLAARFGFAKPIWHDSLADRRARQPGFSWANKTVICGLRRLPEWLYSRHAFEMQRSPQLRHLPENLLDGRFFEQDGVLGYADDYMQKYLPREILDSESVRVIRVEHFHQDFIAAFRDLIPIERVPEREFTVVRNRTRTRDAVARALIDSNIDRIYGSCPYWAEVEARFYPCHRAAASRLDAGSG